MSTYDVLASAALMEGPVAQTQTDKAYRAIKEMMIKGMMTPGERVSERALADATGVSRTPIRSALVRLESERLVERDKSSGLRVTLLEEKDIVDIFTVQAELEALAARMAIERAADFEIAAIPELLEVASISYDRGDLEVTIEANGRFHDTLYTLSHSQWLSAAFGSLRGQLAQIRAVITHLVHRPTFSEEHYVIYEALRDRDVDWAVLTVRRHIETDLVVARRHIRSVVAGDRAAEADNVLDSIGARHRSSK